MCVSICVGVRACSLVFVGARPVLYLWVLVKLYSKLN